MGEKVGTVAMFEKQVENEGIRRKKTVKKQSLSKTQESGDVELLFTAVMSRKMRKDKDSPTICAACCSPIHEPPSSVFAGVVAEEIILLLPGGKRGI